MPQFDKITFFNQIFWLILLFLVFYMFLLKNYLPIISSTLKVRNKKLLKGAGLLGELLSETSNVYLESNQLASNILVDYGNKLDKQKTKTISSLNGYSKDVQSISKVVDFYYKSYTKVTLKKLLVTS